MVLTYSSNSYGGLNNITSGTLSGNAIANAGANSSYGQGNFTLTNGATLEYTGGTASTDRTLTLDTGGGIVSVTNAATNLTWNGVISGSGSFGKAGLGKLTLSAANTFTGDTKVSGGTLLLNNPLALQNSTLDYNNYGGTLSVGSASAVSLAGLTGSQPLSLLNSSSASVALTIGSDGANTGYSGQLTGASSLTKIGNGTQTLTGDFSFTSGMTINDGKLVVNGSMTGPTTINAAGTLAGTSSLTGNVTNSGHVAPGNSPAIITINGDYTQTATGLLEIQVGGLTPGTQHDQVQVTGHTTLGGTITFPFINGFVPQANDQITFLTSGSISGIQKSSPLPICKA